MTRTEKKMVERNLDLIFEFEKYVLEHPGFGKGIPRNAVVIMQVEGDKRFNLWSNRLAEKHVKRGKPVFRVTIKKMKPIRSRIQHLRVEQAA